MKAVIFDLGRVLIGYDHAQTVRGLAAFAGAQEDVVRAAVLEADRKFGLGQLDGAAFAALLRERTGMPDVFDDFYAAFTAGLTRDEEALAYAVELEARPDVLVAVLSNTNELHVRWLDEHVPELGTFDLVMMSNEIGMTKPDAAVYRLALELLDVCAQQAVFVDDARANVEAAQEAGLYGIVHEDWQQTRSLLEEWLRE